MPYIAALIYLATGIVSLLIAIDFFLSKDGVLRKILIFLFSAWAFHYLAASLLFLHSTSLTTFSSLSSVATAIDFIPLLLLYFYFRWKN